MPLLEESHQIPSFYCTVSFFTVETRKLDFNQRKVVEIGINYCRGLIKSQKLKNPLPNPKNVIVSGGAGSGKSKTIEILSKWCHHLLQQNYMTGTSLGDTCYSPYVVIVAPTGSAAANIRGQTLHSAFNLNWGNEPSKRNKPSRGNAFIIGLLDFAGGCAWVRVDGWSLVE